MKIGFDNSVGQLTFTFEADELREAQKLLELFDGQGDENVARILEVVELWAQTMEHRQ